jgi:hypothetical protein
MAAPAKDVSAETNDSTTGDEAATEPEPTTETASDADEGSGAGQDASQE